MEQNQFVIAAVILALLIAVLAPFLASGDPDGLESAFFSMHGAKTVTGADLDEGQAGLAEEQVVETTGNTFEFEAPMPDYSIPGMDKAGEVIAIVAGTVLVLGLAWAAGRFIARPGQ